VEASEMMAQFWLTLKSQRYLLPLFLVVVVFQLVLGQASSYVLAERQPPLGLAIQQQGEDEASNLIVEKLSSVDEFEIISVDNSLSSQEVFRTERVQGLLVIPANYDELVKTGRDSSVTFYPAPGITNHDFATEQIAAVVVQIRARYSLDEALADLGAQTYIDEGITPSDLLDVVYEGPALQAAEQGAAPVYGVSALLVLLAFLHAALTVPTREDKRLVARGTQSFRRQLAMSLLVVWTIWLVVIAAFMALMFVFSGIMPSVLVCAGFMLIMIYSSLLAALLAQFSGRHVASWMFLPLFLLSMTLGGGLWAKVAVSSILAPLIPVAAVSSSSGAVLWGLVTLGLSCILLLVALLIVPRYKASVSI
jgi:hypothetical protein